MQPTYSYLQDRLVPGPEARIPADSGLVLFGMGVFASLICYSGKPFYLEAHHAKLCRGADLLGLAKPDLETLRGQIQATLDANGLTDQDCRMRITLGQGNIHGPDVFLISVGKLPAHVSTAITDVAPWRRNPAHPLAGIKSTGYAENIIARQFASANQLTEVIFLNTRDIVCEGTTSNLFWVSSDGKVLHTPSEDTGCLAGVTRSIVLTLANQLEIPTEEGHYSIADLETASEAFFTSTYRGIQPIQSMMGRKLHVQPGGLTNKLSEQYEKLCLT
jgi:branched-subunit amino acid aminotransferase/4-amino-4-deoxychorismate lyase